MDMNFSFDEATPLAAPALGFAELMAAMRTARATTPSAGGVMLASSGASLAPAAVTTLLADVVLGRSNWRTASLTLGGRFADVSNAGASNAGTTVFAERA